ncbi:MAG TPA: MFS transporter, partial [Ktedonobacterales bacterium]|nr:MFS transporter [Ktedonobacterales bacterium]
KRPSASSTAQPDPENHSELATSAASTSHMLGARSRLPFAFIALRHSNFRLYWSGQLISFMGTWMQTIGQAWLVLALTHSGLQLGIVGALQALPVLLFSLFGGVFADRWPKRRVLLATQSAAMIQAGTLWALVATGAIQLWHLYVLALLLGVSNSLGRPTSQAFVVEMVGREDLPNAVALNSATGNLARIVGPGLGGLIIAASGVSTLFLLNALSFLAVIGSLVLIKGHELHTHAHRHPDGGERWSMWHSLGEGLDYVWKTPAVLLVIVVVGLVLLFGSNFSVVLPLFATDVLHVGATGFGLLSAAIGAGSLLATLWLAWSDRQPTIRGVLIGTVAFGALEALLAVARFFPLAVLLVASIGFAEMAFAALALTLLQMVPPDHLRGRVMSVSILFFDGSVPLGYLLVGWLAGLYGASITVLICGVLSSVVAGAGWVWHISAEKGVAPSASS